MADPIKLVTPPLAKEADKQAILDLLDKARREVESGEIEGVLFVFLRCDGCWKWNLKGVPRVTSLLGDMEIIKAEITSAYIKGEFEQDGDG